ncbi:MAG: metalloregulator ArsR/SmtB family transcription factor [Endomicrobiaceae bacterium]|jgi:ArsR family transcriptional regulator|nr:metalloregulator ArsR/SmtB family transcription factor [Endomicrobiaceae bacterium]
MSFNAEKDSELLKALGHPIRLKIVAGLMEHDGCNVSKMVDNLGISQSNASQHLAILKRSGILKATRNGTKTCFSISDKRVANIIQALKK